MKKTTESTHTPLYFGVSVDTVCARHGEMERKHTPLIERDERIYVPRDGVALYACPECCLDLFAIAGDPNPDPERTTTLLWKRYVEDDWDVINRLFVDLGPGRIETRDGNAAVLLDDTDQAAIPAYLLDCDDSILRKRSRE